MSQKELDGALITSPRVPTFIYLGQLDCSWVVRWLDDVGLPQYKETFLESRVDGRLLNLLTVEDLSYLKVNNLLHHLSIKRFSLFYEHKGIVVTCFLNVKNRGIQVLRHNNFNFDFLTRRAVPGKQFPVSRFHPSLLC